MVAAECRKSPGEVEINVASHGWTSWGVKKEPLTKFASLPAMISTKVIDLDSPSPVKKEVAKRSFWSAVPSGAAAASTSMPARPIKNPKNSELDLPFTDEETLSDVLMDFMDDEENMPQVGEAPEEEF